MQTVTKISELRKLLSQARSQGQLIGLVPTMGAFHAGHISLMAAAKKECDLVVVSLFVNPTQFGPGEDYQKYPRFFATDKKIAAENKVDVLFAPTVKEMYKTKPLTKVEVAKLSNKLCGHYRPSHFAGVATVVAKLFNIVLPAKAYFGEKDWQQLQIIKKMTKELNFPVKIVGLPTVREKDGLAMSSRNMYLNSQERKAATVLYKALKMGADLIKNGEKNCAVLKKQMENYIASEPLVKLQYLTICQPQTLNDRKRIGKQNLIAVAAYVGSARLIDNILVKL